MPSRRRPLRVFSGSCLEGVIEMNRHHQLFDSLPEEASRKFGKSLFPWIAAFDGKGFSFAEVADQVLKAHDYERERIGQELHDSAGQLLVSLQLSVARLRNVDENCLQERLLEEILDTVGQIDREIRTLSFLHHPAELGETGLCSAVGLLVRGFGRRTGICTSFKCLGGQITVDESISIAVLRVAQEALGEHPPSFARLYRKGRTRETRRPTSIDRF